MNRMDSKNRVLLGLLTVGLLCLPVGAQSARDARADAPKSTKEVEKLEGDIAGVILKSFPETFAMLNPPKGGYLPGYGDVFTFTIKINGGTIETPFGKMRSGPDVTPQEKRKRIDILKDGLVRVLFESGNQLSNLQKTDCIAIMAYFEETNLLVTGGKEKSALVMSISKSDLTEMANKQDMFNQFKQRVKSVEY